MEPALGQPAGVQKNPFSSLGWSNDHNEVCSQELLQVLTALMGTKGFGDGNVCVNPEVVDGDNTGLEPG